MRKIVINLELKKEQVNKLREKYKEFIFVTTKESGYHFEETKNEDKLIEELKDAEVLISFQCTKEMIDYGPKLKWIQAGSAGVDALPLEEIKKRGIVLTNGRGVHKTHMSEYAIASMINLARNFHTMFRNQIHKKWDRSVEQGEIYGSTVGIIGLGSIGLEIAKKASFLGMNVIGVKNTPTKLEYVNEVYGPEEMGVVFSKSDYVINLLPYTKDTHKIIDNKYFNLMKESASFINIGRGETVNEEDLIEIIKDRKIKALVTDVFYKEPLSEESPLWELDNVILTPHICGVSPEYNDRLLDIIEKNLSAYIENKENMINVIDLEEGY